MWQGIFALLAPKGPGKISVQGVFYSMIETKGEGHESADGYHIPRPTG